MLVLPAIVPVCTSPKLALIIRVPEIALPKLKVLALNPLVAALLINVLAMSLFNVVPVNACFKTTLFCRFVISVAAVFKSVLIAEKLSLNPCELLLIPGTG